MKYILLKDEDQLLKIHLFPITLLHFSIAYALQVISVYHIDIGETYNDVLMTVSVSFIFSDVVLEVWNYPWREYLYHRNH